MIKRFINCAIIAFAALLTGCIENNVPYPYIELDVLKMAVDGQISSKINKEMRTVTFEIAEVADLRKLAITELKVTDQATSSMAVGEVLDLTEPDTLSLSLYQTFEWRLVANQPIERYFNVKGQIGEARISTSSHKAIAQVAIGTDISNVDITALKLGPEGATMTPALSEIRDFTNSINPPKVTVSYLDKVEEWELYVVVTSSNVNTGTVNPWVKIAWLEGSCAEGMVAGFEYCLNDGKDNWMSVNPALVEQDGTLFKAKLTGLSEQTSYKCRAVADGEYGAEVSFMTNEATPLPNGSMDSWWLDGKVWCPWEEGATNFWDTGNIGTTTLGESNTQPTENEKWDSKSDGRGAKLESKFVGIGSVGKFAAGNIYVGDFKQVDGTNGILDFGKPFTSFPTRLCGYYRYETKLVDITNNETAHMAGKPDTCSIYIALGDWDDQVEIRTRPSNRKLFDKEDPNIIAYAEMYSGESTDGYVPFSLELDYRELGRTPKYIIIVLSASKYGDFFTGGDGATMWIDELRLEYD